MMTMTERPADSRRGPLLVALAGFPPLVTGSATLNYNLWATWPGTEVVIAARQWDVVRGDDRHLALRPTLRRVQTFLFRHPGLCHRLEPLAGLAVARQLRGFAQETGARAIWANWPTTSFSLGAWWAARRLRIPLYFHMHDMWEESFQHSNLWVERLAAKAFERRILRSARRVFAITTEARSYLATKLGIDSYVLDHPVPDADLADPSTGTLAGAPRPVIHFAGNVYRLMNLDAVRNVAACLPLLPEGYTFEVYTPRSVEALAKAGVPLTRVDVKFGTKPEVMRAQRDAAVLCLPLAFDSSSPTEIRTVFPTKLLEYFVSGRPILVHAPPDSWASQAARRDGWAEVVDQPDPVLLAQKVRALLEDRDRQQALVRAAFAEARRRAVSRVVAGLRSELGRLEGQVQTQA